MKAPFRDLNTDQYCSQPSERVPAKPWGEEDKLPVRKPTKSKRELTKACIKSQIHSNTLVNHLGGGVCVSQEYAAVRRSETERRERLWDAGTSHWDHTRMLTYRPTVRRGQSRSGEVFELGKAMQTMRLRRSAALGAPFTSRAPRSRGSSTRQTWPSCRIRACRRRYDRVVSKE